VAAATFLKTKIAEVEEQIMAVRASIRKLRDVKPMTTELEPDLGPEPEPEPAAQPEPECYSTTCSSIISMLGSMHLLRRVSSVKHWLC
jgi:hypothetical protein